MNEDKQDEPFAELQRAVSEGKIAGPAEPRQRRLLPSAKHEGAVPDPVEAFVEEAAIAFEKRLAEYLDHLEMNGLDSYEILGAPKDFAERAVRAVLPQAD